MSILLVRGRAIARPRLIVAGRAWPSLAVPRPACRAMPCLPSQAAPCPDTPRRAEPGRAAPAKNLSCFVFARNVKHTERAFALRAPLANTNGKARRIEQVYDLLCAQNVGIVANA